MKKLILDTDLGTDSDDIGALMILNQFTLEKKAQLIGVTNCLGRAEGAIAVDIINNYYKNSIPVGKCKDESKFSSPQFGTYARAIAYCYDSIYKRCPIPDAVKVLRKLFAHNDKVTLVTIGMLNNIADFLQSPRDVISPLSGYELASQKLERAYIMGGNFTDNVGEWNILQDIPAAKIVADAIQDIVFVPFEVGVRVLSGEKVLSGKDTPMKCGYFVHNISKRESWDPITAYLAVTDSKMFELSPYGRVTVREDGVTEFCEGKGRHRYVKAAFDKEAVASELEKLMTV